MAEGLSKRSNNMTHHCFLKETENDKNIKS